MGQEGGPENVGSKTEVPAVFGPSAETLEFDNQSPVGALARNAGLNSTNMKENYRRFEPAECERVVFGNGHHDAYIVFGRDRPAGKTMDQKGHGPKGHHGAHMIDIVVGRKSCYRAETADGALITHTYDNKGNTVSHIPADPDFMFDAARIYICQKADIDDYFGLKNNGITGDQVTGKSCVAMCADDLRFISRSGTRLVTAYGNYNSAGAKNAQKGMGVALIHGNQLEGPGYTLQPMVLGTALVDFLTSLMDQVSGNTGMIGNIEKMLIAFYTAMASHQHITAPPSPESAAAGVLGIIESSKTIANNLPASLASDAILKANSLTPFGAKGILSSWHSLN